MFNDRERKNLEIMKGGQTIIGKEFNDNYDYNHNDYNYDWIVIKWKNLPQK